MTQYGITDLEPISPIGFHRPFGGLDFLFDDEVLGVNGMVA